MFTCCEESSKPVRDEYFKKKKKIPLKQMFHKTNVP